MIRAALVEPDVSAARQLERALAREGYGVVRYASLGRFLDSFARRRPDVALLNLHPPGMDGCEIIRALRGDPENRRLVVVALSSRRERGEAVAAFQAGADEYLAEPVDAEFLAVRLKSLLRRVPAPPEEEFFTHGPIAVHPASRICRVVEKGVRLSRLEFDLLLKFVQNPGRVFTRGNLIDTIWHGEKSRGARAVDRHIYALRAKLGRCGGQLHTLVGIGYCLSPQRGGVLSGSSK